MAVLLHTPICKLLAHSFAARYKTRGSLALEDKLCVTRKTLLIAIKAVAGRTALPKSLRQNRVAPQKASQRSIRAGYAIVDERRDS
jgi:hypothetical protein